MASYGAEQSSARISDLSDKVDNVKGVMRDNLNKVVERGERLEDLEERTDLLNQNAGYFQKSATNLKRKLWWQNVKLWIILIIIIVVILVVIIAAIAIGVATSQNNS